MSELVDVAIVGYGPVGQALALYLLRQGYRVTALERWPDLYGMPRAVTLDHEAMRILQSLDVTDALLPYTCLSERYQWLNASGQVLLSFEGLDRPMPSGWPAHTGFCQPDLERLLDERVRQHANGTVMQGWEVTAIDELADRVVVHARSHAEPKKTRSIAARYVVGCDGAGSFVRQAIGEGYRDLGFSADWLVVDVAPKNPADWSSELVQICDPALPTTLVGSGPGRRRLEFMLLPGEQKEPMNKPDVAWRLLSKWNWRPDNAVLERHAVYTFRGCVAHKWRRGRLMLAGDAAHLTPPFAGQGLCAGLRDVAALAWRIDAVLGGQASEDVFESYGVERSGHAQAFIEFAIALGHVICVLDPEAAAARDRQMLMGPAEDKYPPSRIAGSALLRANDPAAGTLAMQARVQAGEKAGRFDDIVGRGFVLLGLNHDPAARLDATQRAFLEKIGVRAIAIGEGMSLKDVDGAYARWFAELGCDAVLIRPDFYLFGAGEAGAITDGLRGAGVWEGPRVAEVA